MRETFPTKTISLKGGHCDSDEEKQAVHEQQPKLERKSVAAPCAPEVKRVLAQVRNWKTQFDLDVPTLHQSTHTFPTEIIQEPLRSCQPPFLAHVWWNLTQELKGVTEQTASCAVMPS